MPINEAARYYGLDVGRNGMACCPFHDDKNPSMKIYEDNYFCFGCRASGDVVNFTARLFSLSQYQAAVKLSEDFRLDVVNREFAVPSKNPLDERNRFAEWDKSAFLAVNKYMKLLKRWRQDYAPKNIDEPLHPLFTESLCEMTTTEYLLDTLTFGSREEKLFLWKNNKDMIHRISERVKASENKKIRRRR